MWASCTYFQIEDDFFAGHSISTFCPRNQKLRGTRIPSHHCRIVSSWNFYGDEIGDDPLTVTKPRLINFRRICSCSLRTSQILHVRNYVGIRMPVPLKEKTRPIPFSHAFLCGPVYEFAVATGTNCGRSENTCLLQRYNYSLRFQQVKQKEAATFSFEAIQSKRNLLHHSSNKSRRNRERQQTYRYRDIGICNEIEKSTIRNEHSQRVSLIVISESTKHLSCSYCTRNLSQVEEVQIS